MMGLGKLFRRQQEAGCDPETRYRLGVPSNLFSGVLPEGIYYPEYTSLEDYRPGEFISLAGQALGKSWRQCTVLDLGCGEGTSTVAIGRTGARVIGIDGRPEVLARGRYLRDRLGYTNVEFRPGSVLDASLWEKADAVYASGLIHHLEQPFRLMELIGQFCSDLAYFCTHLAPASEARRAGSFFAGLLHDAGAMEFRGRSLPGIRFSEGNDTREQTWRRRRNPRHGIGNSYSWWPTEESFVAAMKEVGFPAARRLFAHEYRLRHRLCFRRNGEIPGAGGERVSFLWNLPERPHPDAAAERSLAADTAFLARAGISPAVAGDPDMIERIVARLGAAGIRSSKTYLAGVARQGGLPEGLASDGPEFVVFATARFAQLKSWMTDLSTLRACRYAFSSFTLPEIREFPALVDPVTGEPVTSRFSSRFTY
jgi:SAM-dependent methyltransferase